MSHPRNEDLASAAIHAGHRQLRAAIYTRVSQDRRGTKCSVEEQEHEARGVVARESWSLQGVWSDNDRSASQYARKGRPDWERLLQTIERGEIDVLVVWEPSRATRDRQVWAALAALCQERSVLINASGKTQDPTDPDDMFALDLFFAIAIRESAATRKRVKRSMRAAARKGRPHGHVPYGYRRIYDVNTGDLLSQVPQEPQASVVKEIFRRVAAAEKLDRIAEDLNRRGVAAPGDQRWTGSVVRRAITVIRRRLEPDEEMLVLDIRADLKAGLSTTEIARRLASEGVPVLVNTGWTYQSVHALAVNRTYVGRRTHHGETVTTIREDGLAEWPALVSQESFDAAQRALAVPGREKSRPGAARHLLSGIALCDVCGLPVGHVPRRGSPFYGCKTKPSGGRSGFHVGRAEYKVDAYVLSLMFARLSRPDAAELFSDSSAGEESAALNRAIGDDERYLEELYAQARDPDPAQRLSARALGAIEAEVQARIVANRSRLEQVQVSPLVRDLIAAAPGEVGERFELLAFEQKREVIRHTMEIRITTIGPGGNHVPIEETVRVRWLRSRFLPKA